MNGTGVDAPSAIVEMRIRKRQAEQSRFMMHLDLVAFSWCPNPQEWRGRILSCPAPIYNARRKSVAGLLKRILETRQVQLLSGFFCFCQRIPRTAVRSEHEFPANRSLALT